MTQIVRRVNNALLRADKAGRAGEPGDGILPAGRRLAPVVADAGGAPEAFELMTAMIEAGAAGVRFEDQLPAGKDASIPGGRSLSRPGSTSRRWPRPGSPPTCSTSRRW